MASEIQLTSQDNSEINLTLNESPSSIDVNFQEGSTINSVVQEPSVISYTLPPVVIVRTDQSGTVSLYGYKKFCTNIFKLWRS